MVGVDKMANAPEVSIIIVNWNGKHFLEKCLPAVQAQSYNDYEVVVVDNASSDTSVKYCQENFPEIKLIVNQKNVGFAAANNQAVARCSGRYVLLLNNDAILEVDTLEKLVGAFYLDENCVLNPLQYDWNNKFIGAGFPAPWVAKLLARFIKIEGERPFYSCLACCLTSKKILEDFPLNEKLFFFEDTEWGWRLLLAGIPTKVLESAKFLHKYSGTVKNTPLEAFVCGRVAIATYFICFSFLSFVLFLPILLLGYYGKRLLRYLVRPKLLGQFTLGFFDFFRQIGFFHNWRRQVQQKRTISDWRVIRQMLASVNYDQRTKARYG